MNENQKGLAGAVELALLGVLAIVIVFAGTRIYTATRQADEYNTGAEKISETQPNFSELKKAEQEKTEPEEETKTEEPKTEETVVKKETEPVVKEDKPAPTYTEIKISASGSQTDTQVLAAIDLKSTYTGTCEVYYKKDGQEKVYVGKVSVSGASTCNVTADKSMFPVSGEWTGLASFFNSDKTVKGYASFTINVTK